MPTFVRVDGLAPAAGSCFHVLFVRSSSHRSFVALLLASKPAKNHAFASSAVDPASKRAGGPAGSCVHVSDARFNAHVSPNAWVPSLPENTIMRSCTGSATAAGVYRAEGPP